MIEESVNVNVSPVQAFEKLHAILERLEYSIENEVVDRKIKARRGSKLKTALFESAKGGFRELLIMIIPHTGGSEGCEVHFRFVFPVWALTTPVAKRDCMDLIEIFKREVRSAQVVSEDDTQMVPCQNCQGMNQADAMFCAKCGKPIEKKQTGLCPSCGKSIPTDAMFCPGCGSKIEVQESGPKICPSCGKEAQEGAKFCMACGREV